MNCDCFYMLLKHFIIYCTSFVTPKMNDQLCNRNLLSRIKLSTVVEVGTLLSFHGLIVLFNIIVGAMRKATALRSITDKEPPKKAPISGINRVEYQI